MPRKGSAFAGLTVAITTPFKDGQLDLKMLREQVEFQIAAGTKCLCPTGTTGDSPTLTHEQHERGTQSLCPTDPTELSGDGSLTLPKMAVGSDGVISVVGNIVPSDMLAMVGDYLKGDVTAAMRWHHRLVPLCRDTLGLATNPV